MSIIFSLFIVLFYVSLHACNARHFGVINKDSDSTQLQFCDQACENVKKLDFNTIQRGTNNGDDTINKNNDSSANATPQEAKDWKAILSGQVRNKPFVSSVSSRVPVKNHAGKSPGFFSDYSQPRTRSEIFESSSHVGLLKAESFLEGSRRRAVELNNNKADEDVAAVMDDYEPPHQTPPIHNGQT